MSIVPVETGAISPSVRIKLGAWLPLNPMVNRLLVRTVVDTSLLRPDMFELTFLDRDGTALDEAKLGIGTEVKVSVGDGSALMMGEVTSIEGDYDHLLHHTVVRGYEQTHRLRRARRSRTFEQSTDGQIVRRVAQEAKLEIGAIDDPGVTHRYVAQVAQTDWEFLQGRATEIGYETGVADGKFYFRKAPGMASPGPGGGLANAAASAAGLGDKPVLTFGHNLRWLRPRISSIGLTKEAEVRVWDADGAKVVSARAPLTSATASIENDAGELAAAHPMPGMPAIPAIPLLPSFLGASDTAVVVVDRPLGWGADAQSAADSVAAGVAEHVASTFAEAEGGCIATPGVVAGALVAFKQVPKLFEGDWYVTTARHVFEVSTGYNVRFEVSGRHDRSLHGLVTGGASAAAARGLLAGPVPGVVTDNIDPENRYRVRVALPWLSSDFVTDWARVVMPGLGATHGLVLVPEVNDEVLVGFEFGDVRRAYVLGGVATSKTKEGLDLGGDVVTTGIPGGVVVRRGLRSREGHKILIDDDAQRRSASGITIGNADDTVSVHLDDLAKELSVTCSATTPAATIRIKQEGSGGGIVIEQSGTGGSISIKSAGDVTIEASAPGRLVLKGGGGVKIDGGTGMVELSGSMVKLN